MDFSAFLALVVSFLNTTFPLSDTVNISIGQLAIFTMVLWISRSFAMSFIRG